MAAEGAAGNLVVAGDSNNFGFKGELYTFSPCDTLTLPNTYLKNSETNAGYTLNTLKRK